MSYNENSNELRFVSVRTMSRSKLQKTSNNVGYNSRDQ